MRPGSGAAVAILITLLAPRAGAVPGPDSVAVVANAGLADSVALAERYARARQIPARQVCALSISATVTIGFDAYQQELVVPLEACLAAAGVSDRIEAFAVMRGVPMRVEIPNGGRVSIAAALGVWRSATRDGRPLIGQPPGMQLTCSGGVPCYGARWTNPFTSGVFAPGWTRETAEATWRPMLATMLHGRTYGDAARLIASATTADALGGARGEFMFMSGGDPVRSLLDSTYPALERSLRERGFDDVSRPPFNSGLNGHTLAVFVIGTAQLGSTIEGNSYAPGAIVDNLTSFGAVPENFSAAGEAQVSIARWVAKGVAGVHGTTDEPLANCFPDRRFVIDYAGGMTLAEAYLRRMPYVYWQNLVLGDPMAAPYARRPAVDLVHVGGKVRATAEDGEGRSIAWLRLFVDGVQTASTAGGGPIESCLPEAGGAEVQVLSVAQIAGRGEEIDGYTPKGWREIRVPAAGCRTAAPDAGFEPDGGHVSDPPPEEDREDRNCSCSSSAGRPNLDFALSFSTCALAALAARRSRKRR